MRILALAAVLLIALPALAGHVDASVLDSDGRPVGDAIVYATAPGRARATPPGVKAVMDQIDKEFVPFVLPVQVGTLVRFPNQDNIRHNVYSFSAPKPFSLQLYRGTEAPPVLFDKPGVVILGCNIHDFMLAYVLVLETPYFARTGADGKARLTDLPAGSYELRAWHPRLPGAAEPASQPVAVAASGSTSATFRLTLQPERSRRIP